MKILFFSHSKRANGGAERCLLELIRGLKESRADWEIYVVFPEKGELWELCRPYLSGYAFIKQPWWLVRPKKVGWRKRLLFHLKKGAAIRKTRKYLRRVSPDLTVTNTLVTPVGAWASRAEKTPHIWFIHEVPEMARNLAYLFDEERCIEEIAALSQEIVVPSNFVKEYYSQKLPAARPISVIYQSVEIPPVRKTEGSRPFTLGLLGNFEPNKGQHLAVEALREVVKQYPDTHLLLIGGNNSQYAKTLRETIEEYGLAPNVTIVPHTLTPHDYLVQADVALVCSGFECFGRVAAEALKCGLPVIAPDKHFGREVVVEGCNGFLYAPADSRDLAAKIVLLRESGKLPEMGRNALKSTENRFTLESFTQAFIAVIHSALS